MLLVLLGLQWTGEQRQGTHRSYVLQFFKNTCTKELEGLKMLCRGDGMLLLLLDLCLYTSTIHMLIQPSNSYSPFSPL